MFTFTKTIAAGALVAGSLGLAALGVAGAANATPAGSSSSTDQDFLNSVQAAGFTGDPAHEIAYAHQVCQGLDNGNSSDAVVSDLAQRSGLSQQGAHKFAILSAEAYCPQYVTHSPSNS